MKADVRRVRLHWANGRVTEMQVDANPTIILVPIGWSTHSFRATGEVDEDGLGVFVEDTDLPPVAD